MYRYQAITSQISRSDFSTIFDFGLIRSTTENCIITIPLHSVHLRLPVQDNLQKNSDESTAVGNIMVGQETEYGELVDCFMAWCGNNHLMLNVTKTTMMITDFRRTVNRSNSIFIIGEKVEVVEEIKYRCVFVGTEQFPS